MTQVVENVIRDLKQIWSIGEKWLRGGGLGSYKTKIMLFNSIVRRKYYMKWKCKNVKGI